MKPTLTNNIVDKKLNHYGKIFLDKKRTVYDDF